MKTLEWTLEQGHPWERLVVVKDKRTRRNRPLKCARATMRLRGGTETFHPTVTLNWEGGATLCISYDETFALAPGTWDFDVVGDFRGHDEKVAQGSIEVIAHDSITSLEGGFDMHIDYVQFTDYRKVFTWLDPQKNTIAVQDARFQARGADDVLVMDLKFFATPPDESAIGGLPEIERGYVSPIAGATLEVHISDQHTIAPGSYSFSLLAREQSGDWGQIVKGTMTVEDSIADPTV